MLTHAAPTQLEPIGHAWLQAPQLLGSVVTSAQKSPMGPMQSCCGGMQVVAHTPLIQLEPGAHTWPHPPQLLGSLEISAHVGPMGPMQNCRPGMQAHTPLTHAAPGKHTLPHAPQLVGSDDTSTQAAPHAIVGGMQPPPPMQVPIWQIAVGGHSWPHMPQLVRSELGSTHTTPPMPGQGIVGAMHAPPFGGAHVPLPFASATQTDEQHADGFWQVAPSGAHGGSPPKSTPTRARPFWCIDKVTCAIIPAPTVTVTGSLTHVGMAPAPGGHCVGNAFALKSTRPVGIPVKLKTELVPGLTLKSNWTERVAAATTRRHPTPGGTCVTSMRAWPIPSGGLTLLEQASAIDKRTMGMMSSVRTFMTSLLRRGDSAALVRGSGAARLAHSRRKSGVLASTVLCKYPTRKNYRKRAQEAGKTAIIALTSATPLR
jgi:hypothetical protein